MELAYHREDSSRVGVKIVSNEETTLKVRGVFTTRPLRNGSRADSRSPGKVQLCPVALKLARQESSKVVHLSALFLSTYLERRGGTSLSVTSSNFNTNSVSVFRAIASVEREYPSRN